MISLSFQTANSPIADPPPSSKPVVVRALENQDAERWDRFVLEHPNGRSSIKWHGNGYWRRPSITKPSTFTPSETVGSSAVAAGFHGFELDGGQVFGLLSTSVVRWYLRRGQGV